MSDKLKPCPFCGNPPKSQTNRAGGLYIFCETNACADPSLESEFPEQDEEIIQIWNRRVPSPVCDALADALRNSLRAIDAFWPSDPPENESEASEDKAIAGVRKMSRAALALYDSQKAQVKA